MSKTTKKPTNQDDAIREIVAEFNDNGTFTADASLVQEVVRERLGIEVSIQRLAAFKAWATRRRWAREQAETTTKPTKTEGPTTTGMTDKQLFDFWCKYWRFLTNRPNLTLEQLRQLLDDIEQELLGWPKPNELVDLETLDSSSELFDYLSDWGDENPETYAGRAGNAEEDLHEVEDLIEQYGPNYVPPRPAEHPRNNKKMLAKEAKAERLQRARISLQVRNYLSDNPTAKAKQVVEALAANGIIVAAGYVRRVKTLIKKAKRVKAVSVVRASLGRE